MTHETLVEIEQRAQVADIPALCAALREEWDKIDKIKDLHRLRESEHPDELWEDMKELISRMTPKANLAITKVKGI